MPRAPFILCLLVLASVPARSASAADGSAESAFAAANELFEAGDHPGASAAYEAIALSGPLSPELHFNLGTAKYREGKPGEAVLWMRRALHLDPGMAEARQSLRFLKARLAYLEFAEGDLDRFLALLDPGLFRWTVSLLVWGAAIALAAAFALPALRERRSTLVTLALLALMAALVTSRVDAYRGKRVAPENFATVTEIGVSAQAAPVPGAASVIDLPPGSELRLLRQSGPWLYADIPGELRGWIRSEAVRPLWPLSTPPHHENAPNPDLEIPRPGEPALPAPGSAAD